MASSLNGTGITFSNATTLSSAPVTSIATGNGLSGGTITTTGTLTIAAPGANTVGSYASVSVLCSVSGCYYATPTFGSNYAAGTGAYQFQAWMGNISGPNNGMGTNSQSSNTLSGTWRWMSGSAGSALAYSYATGIAVRVA